jgi:hypothetical protein
MSGEKGIRTLDTLLEYTRFPGVLLRPLGHLSNINYNVFQGCQITKKISLSKIKFVIFMTILHAKEFQKWF